MGQAIAMQVWSTTGINFENDLIEWANNVLASSTAPPLFSVSYGGTETAFGESFIDKFNTQLMMLGTAGYTIMLYANTYFLLLFFMREGWCPSSSCTALFRGSS